MTAATHLLVGDLQHAIEAACGRGDALSAAKRFDEAIEEYDAALELIPEPKTSFELTIRVLGAIANACFLAGYGASAHDALDFVTHCPGALDNPQIRLRYGQVLFDEDKLERAAEELLRAYQLGGTALFANEDSKYLSFVKTRLQVC